jgi:catechol 2,3-dioxygenase
MCTLSTTLQVRRENIKPPGQLSFTASAPLSFNVGMTQAPAPSYSGSAGAFSSGEDPYSQSSARMPVIKRQALQSKGLGPLEKKEQPIKALGEVVLRVRNLKAMQESYENILGLELFESFDKIVFFKIAPGFEGQMQSLVLISESGGSDHKTRRYSGLDIRKTTLHHFAFARRQSDYQKECDRLQRLGLDVKMQVNEWVHYRSLYICDPNGNVVELVCYD